MKDEKDQDLKKITWGNVEPGPLNEGEAAALRPMQENAARCKDIKATNMDPEPREGGCGNLIETRPVHWQQLSDIEKERCNSRVNGHPRN